MAGGNAVDAAIAATAAQGVVAPETCGVGGDLFALVHRPGWEQPRALNASGRAGSNADPETLRSAGHTEIARDHPLTVTVPGCVDGWSELSTELGNLDLAACLAPAIEFAEEGFEVSTEQAQAFRHTAALYHDHPAVREFYPDGEPVPVGAWVRRGLWQPPCERSPRMAGMPSIGVCLQKTLPLSWAGPSPVTIWRRRMPTG